MVVDCNEDGFREEHVRAICQSGASTKTATSGYIGEKGIGFKSVFRIANKVKIQSGPFSFIFHANEADGLGMVTPWASDHESLPMAVQTRMTLWLARPDDFPARLKDLEAIPESLMIFLNKLQRISLFVDDPPHVSQTSYSYRFDDSNIMGTLTKIMTGGMSTQEFYVIKKDVSHLPKEEKREHTNKAQVVLAFPIDSDQEPLIEQQLVFAFLPIRKAGFSVGLTFNFCEYGC